MGKLSPFFMNTRQNILPPPVSNRVRGRVMSTQKQSFPLSKHREQKIIAALTKTPIAARVAKTLGENPATVRKIAKKAGIELAKRKRLSKEKRRTIIAALNENSNAKQVAQQIGGVSTVAVWMIAKKAGIELTAGKAAGGSGQKVSPERQAEIIAVLAQNPNASQVARQIGDISHVTVGKIAKAAGIQLRRGGRRVNQDVVVSRAGRNGPEVA
jgi:transposase